MTYIKNEASTIDIGIGGMTCASCVMRFEKALNKVLGVESATVNLATESARITVQSNEVTDARLRRAIRDAGYEPLTPQAVETAAQTTAWTGFAPVCWGLLLSAPLVLPMVGDALGQVHVFTKRDGTHS